MQRHTCSLQVKGHWQTAVYQVWTHQISMMRRNVLAVVWEMEALSWARKSRPTTPWNYLKIVPDATWMARSVRPRQALKRWTIVNRTYGTNKNPHIYLLFTPNIWSYILLSFVIPTVARMYTNSSAYVQICLCTNRPQVSLKCKANQH